MENRTIEQGQRGRIPLDQLHLIAYWLESAEAMALWKTLYLDLRRPGDLGNPINAALGAGSLWMGGSSCMCFELKPSWNGGPKSIFSVMERVVVHGTIAHQHIEDECKLSEGFIERTVHRRTYHIRCQGYLSRLFDHIHNGLLGEGFAPPYDTGDEPYLNTPSGWFGWARLLAQIRHDTKRYLFSPNYDKLLSDYPEILQETLGTLGRPIPKQLASVIANHCYQLKLLV